MYELVFTSAKAGLIPGRSGFCSVAWTNGIPQNLVTLLENMSGYNALYAPDDPRAKDNPVCYSYQKIQFGRSQLRVLSRIAFAGLDHTGRSNKIAHHIVLDEKDDKTEIERMKHGPVSVFLNEKNFYTSWNAPPRLLDQRRSLFIEESTGIKAEKWEAFAGNPRWAGYIADIFCGSKDKNSCFYIEYDNERHGSKNILLLIDEITRLMSPEDAQEFTFNTCFSSAQSGCSCFLRAALPTCTALPAIKKFRSNELISLINPVDFTVSAESRNIIRSTGKDFTPEVKPQMMPNSKVHKGGTPQPPASENVIDLSGDMYHGNAAVQSSRRRLLIFSITTCGIFMLIAAAVSAIVLSGSKNGKPQENKVEIAETVPETLPTEEKITLPEDVKEPEKKAESEPEPPKPEPKPEPPKPEPPKPEIKISEEEQFEFFIGFSSGKTDVELPESLHNADEIIITLKEKWDKDLPRISDTDKCMERKGEKEITVFAVKKDENHDISVDRMAPSVMRLFLNKKELTVDDDKNSENKYLPDRGDIKTLTVVKYGRKISLPLEFKEEFGKYIPRGSFNDKLEYQPSAEEKILKDQLEITPRGNYYDNLDSWNRKVKDLNTATDKINKQFAKKCNIAKGQKITISLDDYTELYNDYMAKFKNKQYKPAIDAFKKFLNESCKVSVKDMELFLKKRQKTRFYDFITGLNDDLYTLIRDNAGKHIDKVPNSHDVNTKADLRNAREKYEKEIDAQDIGFNKKLLAKNENKARILGIRKEDAEAIKIDKELKAEDFAKLLNNNIEHYVKREVKDGKNQ